MRRIRQVLQLHFGAGASARVIAGEIGVGRSTVQDYLARVSAAGLVWPLVPDLTDEALERRLFPLRTGASPAPADTPSRTGLRSRAR
jgi:DNA-binding transcriptional regulator LsrR (DeoR family)